MGLWEMFNEYFYNNALKIILFLAAPAIVAGRLSLLQRVGPPL